GGAQSGTDDGEVDEPLPAGRGEVGLRAKQAIRVKGRTRNSEQSGYVPHPNLLPHAGRRGSPVLVILLIFPIGLEGGHEFSTGGPVGIFQLCEFPRPCLPLGILVVSIVPPSRRNRRRDSRPVRKYQLAWRLAAGDVVLAGDDYSRSRHHGAQAA